MDTGIVIAIIGLAGAFIASVFAYKSLKASLKNNIDLALIAAGQRETNRVVEEYHKEVNSKMTLLLETTGKAKKAEGLKEGREIAETETKI